MYLADPNPKNWYEIEKEINPQYLPKPDEVVDEVFEVEVLEDEEDSDDESLTSEKWGIIINVYDEGRDYHGKDFSSCKIL